MKRALISVSDKRNLKKFAAALSNLGIELIVTDGTAREISREGGPVTPVTPVSELTGFAELLGGGIKTLHPAVHAAIATSSITIVVVNLIPLTTIESVDIGGVALLKSAMKNVRNVAAVTDPAVRRCDPGANRERRHLLRDPVEICHHSGGLHRGLRIKGGQCPQGDAEG